MSDALAIHGGVPVRRNGMPPRRAFGEGEFRAVVEAARYYFDRGEDPAYQGRFEEAYCREFAEFLGGGFADAVATGTASVYVALAALECPPGSEVILSPVTDSGPLACIVLQGLIPVLADSAAGSYNTSLDEIRKKVTRETSAILLVHTGGEPVPEVEAICAFAAERGIRVLEDCSQAIGARLGGRITGTFGDIAAFSTMYAKNLSVPGSGGLVYAKTEELYRKVRSHADRGKQAWRSDLDQRNPETSLFPALNFHTDEFSCAAGAASLRRLGETIARRQAFLRMVIGFLEERSAICFPYAFHGGFSPFFFPIFVDTERISCTKVEFARAVAAEGIGVKPHYGCVVSGWEWGGRYFRHGFRTPNAEQVRDRSFNLFVNERYGRREAEDAVEAVVKVERAVGIS